MNDIFYFIIFSKNNRNFFRRNKEKISHPYIFEYILSKYFQYFFFSKKENIYVFKTYFLYVRKGVEIILYWLRCVFDHLLIVYGWRGLMGCVSFLHKEK